MYAYIMPIADTHTGTVSHHTTRLSQHAGKDKESKNIVLKCTPTTDRPQASDIPLTFSDTYQLIQKIYFLSCHNQPPDPAYITSKTYSLKKEQCHHSCSQTMRNLHLTGLQE